MPNIPTEVSKVQSVENLLLPMGWASRSSQLKRTRFTANQKDYVTKKFDLGEISGRKSDPESVARAMMAARDSEGNRFFTSAEFSSFTSSSFHLTSSCFSNSSILHCSSKASSFALISAEVIFAQIVANWEDFAIVEVLLKFNLKELNPLELSSALSSRCALASNLAS